MASFMWGIPTSNLLAYARVPLYSFGHISIAGPSNGTYMMCLNGARANVSELTSFCFEAFYCPSSDVNSTNNCSNIPWPCEDHTTTYPSAFSCVNNTWVGPPPPSNCFLNSSGQFQNCSNGSVYLIPNITANLPIGTHPLSISLNPHLPLFPSYPLNSYHSHYTKRPPRYYRKPFYIKQCHSDRKSFSASDRQWLSGGSFGHFEP